MSGIQLNLGHGHVFPRPDGARARCGGPAICAECAKDAARKAAEEAAAPKCEECERAFKLLAEYGIPRERARTVAGGIDVLATRYAKAISLLMTEVDDLSGALEREGD